MNFNKFPRSSSTLNLFPCFSKIIKSLFLIWGGIFNSIVFSLYTYPLPRHSLHSHSFSLYFSQISAIEFFKFEVKPCFACCFVILQFIIIYLVKLFGHIMSFVYIIINDKKLQYFCYNFIHLPPKILLHPLAKLSNV